ncbi:MAG TPA: protein kinase [Candidatus Eisenbacteria bacterium]|jgi:WD40 repeat protein
MALSAGTRLGPYEILAPLGAGGMGEVYRARDTRLGREVAVKVLPTAYSADPDRMRRFEQEARSAAALNHPNIVAIYDVGTHEGASYVVSELLEGMILRERLAGGAIPQRKAVDFALDIACGLAAAHAKGIAHRDLKPENLFVTRDGRIKILDFGLAKLIRPDASEPGRSKAPTLGIDTDPGMILGTVGYMAPEQVRGVPADHRADIFALGAILHEMLTGKRPFHRPTAVETMNAILKDDPPDLSVAPRPVPPALERIVLHCLEKDPAARFQSAQDIAFNLEALSGLSEPSGAVVRTARARRGLRPALAVLAGFAVVLAAFAAGRATQGRRGTAPEYRQLTFQKGPVFAARFAPDGQTFVYAAAWEGGPCELYLGRSGSPESRSMGIRMANLLAMSSSGEMALCLGPRRAAALVTRGTLARVPLAGGAPREILANVLGADWSPDGSSLAVVREAEGTFRLEYPIGTLLFETRGWMSHPRVSPGGDMVAFLFHPAQGDDRGAVMVVDRARKARRLSPEWSTTGGLAWSARGREVWFTAGRGSGERALYAVSLSGDLRVVARVPGGVTLHDISRDGRVLLTSDDQRSDLCGLLAGDETERDLTWLDFSIPADISPDNKTVLFSEQGAAAGQLYSVFVRGMDGSPATRLGDGQALAFSPDAHAALTLLYTTPPRLVILPTGPGEAKWLPNPGFERYREYPVTWTPDGKSIVFPAGQSGRPLRCYVQSVETGVTRAVTPEGFPDFVLSARGDSVYAGGAGGTVWAYPVAGGKPTPLSAKGLESEDHVLRLNKDGRSVYMFQELGQSAKLVRLDLRTRQRSLVRELRPTDTAGLVGVQTVVVSPDGQAVVFRARRYLSRLYLAEGLQ